MVYDTVKAKDEKEAREKLKEKYPKAWHIGLLHPDPSAKPDKNGNFTFHFYARFV